MKRKSAHGFTLLELLAVTACIGILAALSVGASRSALKSASKVREISAARSLTAALITTPNELSGRYLPGMDLQANSATNPVYRPDGQMVSSPIAARRYPYRLAPYLGNSFDGTILVNKNTKQIQQMTLLNADYYISAYPALGMNVFGVGGVKTADGVVRFESDCVTTPARMKGSILAFASAGQGLGSEKIEGYCYITPPNLTWDSPSAKPWSGLESWKPSADPKGFGNVDFRYDNKAVCAFLDGSVRMCSIEELNDMRLWTPNAAEENNPNYTMTP